MKLSFFYFIKDGLVTLHSKYNGFEKKPLVALMQIAASGFEKGHWYLLCKA